MDCQPLSSHPDQPRVSGLLKEFETRFGSPPSQVIQVPGRVNLIGEHIDYCGYAVLPMAIEQSVLVAVKHEKRSSGGGGKLVLENAQSERYPRFECSLPSSSAGGISIPTSDPRWHNYFLCGLKGVLEEEGRDFDGSLTCLVDGTIPPSAGLSSSSALVVSAALAVSTLNVTISKENLADLCAKSERFIGTQGGGMDQAIEILARSGIAKLIEFNPLKTFDVSLPDGAIFVITNSLAESNKAAGSDYNARVAECRMATKVLGKKLSLPDWNKHLRLGDLQKASGVTLKDMAGKVSELLKVEPYSKQEIVDILGIPEEELTASCLYGNTSAMTEFHLYKRAMHVFTEAQRVYDFKAACDGAAGPDTLQALGDLMFQSHESCSRHYECSHPSLDRLVELAKEHGAIGARLTGAGWGGCSVALVPKDRVDAYLAGMKKDYYDGLEVAAKATPASYIFPTQPGRGAAVYDAAS